jgi:hypothetical protein
MINFSDPKQVYKHVTMNGCLSRGQSSYRLTILLLQKKIMLPMFDNVSDMIWQSAGSNSVTIF